MQCDVAIVGCGRPGEGSGGSHSIGRAHAKAYTQLENTRIVAACDISKENLSQFGQEYGVTDLFADYREMFSRRKVDIVSVCVWPPLHEEIVIAAAESGVKAILCEKPMTLSLGAAKRMIETCASSDVTLCVNHQRRLGDPWKTAKEIIDRGKIGRVISIEASCPEWDLFSWGTHWVDIARFLAGDVPVRWVAAQIDASRRLERYGHHVENDGITVWEFENGIRSTLWTGDHAPRGFYNRVLGTDGVIEINVPDQPRLRYMSFEEPGWQVPDALTRRDLFAESIKEVIKGIEGSGVPAHRAEAAFEVMQVIMAAFESSRIGRPVHLPLQTEGAILEEIVQEG